MTTYDETGLCTYEDCYLPWSEHTLRLRRLHRARLDGHTTSSLTPTMPTAPPVIQVPEQVRKLRQQAKVKVAAGIEPTEEEKQARREYGRARWKQLPPKQKAREIHSSNARRAEKRRRKGTAEVREQVLRRAQVRLARKHPKTFLHLVQVEAASAGIDNLDLVLGEAEALLKGDESADQGEASPTAA